MNGHVTHAECHLSISSMRLLGVMVAFKSIRAPLAVADLPS